LTVFTAGMDMVFPNAMAGAMKRFPRVTGAASALFGFFQMRHATAVSTLARLLLHTIHLSMGLITTGTSALVPAAFTGLVGWCRLAL